MSIRPASAADVEALCSLDLVARQEGGRREFIRGAVAAGTCHIAAADGLVVGYAVLNYNFYGQGFVDMLYVESGHRRRGAGAALLRAMEGLCRTRKLFTSTNLSNLPMQSLLARLGYELSGVIHNLDEGDPELVYFKLLRRTGRAD
ncbi:MAG: GNAT family N-acetyltransferase [Acidobacteria bacterium]|nr:GNAT family N-acetyltransferase [Acidobacteriota bacterium]